MEMPFDQIFGGLFSVGVCCFVSVIYVASLYVWKSTLERNHPTSIKQRFISVFCMLIVSPIILYLSMGRDVLKKTPLSDLVGLKTNGLLQAAVLPWFLTNLLFLGPTAMSFFNGSIKYLFEPKYWKDNFTDLIWLRNHIVAPLSEEFTFRCCMMPILLQYFSPFYVVLIVPLFFGVAHFHHLKEKLREGVEFKVAIQISCVQFAFTTLFGMYSAYLFVRTGHFLAVFLVHAYCNHMGLPNFEELLSYQGNKRKILYAIFILGSILWCFLLNPLTEPILYGNENAWWNNQN